MPIRKEAMEVAEIIFRLTDTLPRKEDYGFTSQLKRSALSISANIAEAFGRNHTLDKINFYSMARGSLTETESHVEYGKRVRYITEKDSEELGNHLSKLHNDINKVIRTLKNSTG